MKRLTVTIPAGRNTPGLRDKIKCLFFDWGFVGLSWKKRWRYRVTVHAKAGQSGKLFGRSRGFRSGYNPDSSTPSHWYNVAHGNSDRVAWSRTEKSIKLYTYCYINKARPYEELLRARSKLIASTFPSRSIDVSMVMEYPFTRFDALLSFLHAHSRRPSIGLAFFPYAQEGTGPVTSDVTITYEKV